APDRWRYDSRFGEHRDRQAAECLRGARVFELQGGLAAAACNAEHLRGSGFAGQPGLSEHQLRATERSRGRANIAGRRGHHATGLTEQVEIWRRVTESIQACGLPRL